MLIKLAICNDEKQQKYISECCEKYESLFIPINENKFGILAESPYEMSLGRESEEDVSDFNIKNFVDIYNCAKNERDTFLRIFRRQKRRYEVPYVGMVLDNMFFFSLFMFCETQDIPISYVYFILDDKTPYISEDPNEIKNELNKHEENKILKLCINLKNRDIIFSKSGYIDIAAKLEFYKTNRNIIQKMISVGIG